MTQAAGHSASQLGELRGMPFFVEHADGLVDAGNAREPFPIHPLSIIVELGAAIPRKVSVENRDRGDGGVDAGPEQ
ncbi:hypothetical protein [Sphingobium tyrosinilyticum]|uniref:Uncharacterized protein n=1 Tax=Sphingobium tyrosinilyticum TaxID=2715436 RepID=A0ABV9F2B1_9SPHN